MAVQPELNQLLDQLRDSNWGLERTPGGRWKATPPDKTKAIVHIAASQDNQSLKNVIADLRRSGFIAENDPRSKRPAQLHVVPNPPPSEKPVEQYYFAPETKPEAFHDALRRLRVASGSTQDEVASLLEVTYRAVCAWESGVNNPVRDHYTKLLVIFPELVHAAEPDTQDRPKPDGGAGGERFYPRPTPPSTPIVESTVEEDIESAIDTPPTFKEIIMTQPASQPVPVQTALIVRFVKLSSDVQASGGKDQTVKLLQEARRLGMNINDVIMMLGAE